MTYYRVRRGSVAEEVALAAVRVEEEIEGLRRELAERPDDYVSTEVYDQVYQEREELQQQVKTLAEELVRARNERRNFQIRKIENGARAERAERERDELKEKLAQKEWVAAEPQTFDYKRAYQELKKQFPSEDQERINRQAAEITRLLEAKEQLKEQVADLHEKLARAECWQGFHRASADRAFESVLARGRRIQELESELSEALLSKDFYQEQSRKGVQKLEKIRDEIARNPWVHAENLERKVREILDA